MSNRDKIREARSVGMRKAKAMDEADDVPSWYRDFVKGGSTLLSRCEIYGKPQQRRYNRWGE